MARGTSGSIGAGRSTDMAMRQTSAFGALLKRYRQTTGLTQEALAEQAGLSVRAISDLERGLKVRPHQDTVALLAAALQLSPAEHAAFVAARQGSAPPAASAELPPFVGRGCELVLLERHLAGEGPPLLLLAGEPGIGKSRLLQEAEQQAGAHGLCALAGGCQRQGDQAPYAPLLPALARHLQAQLPAQLRADLRGCAWLVRLLPELAGGPIEPLPTWTVPPEQERRLLFAAVAQYLRNVAGPAGTLLLLDDLQWAGPDALALLASLLHADAPLRIIGAYRDTEVPAQDVLASTLADLAHAGLAGQHALGPLAPTDAARLLAALLPEEGAGEGAQREQVVQRAGGVPFVLVSYAQALRTHLLEARPTDVAVPWDVVQGVRQRVAALPPLAQELLGIAAVLGRQAPRSVLQGVVAQPQEALVAALEGACQARLLEEEPEGYRFAHDVIREVVEGQLSGGRRRLLHRRAAETLEQQEGTPPVELLAYHYARSAVQDKAVQYLEQAGDWARERLAHAAAEGYYRELVERLDGLGRMRDAAGAREKLGTVLTTVGRHDEALAVLEQAAETHRATRDQASLGRVTAQIGWTHAERGTPHEGVARLEPRLAALEAQVSAHELAALHAALAHLFYVSGQYGRQLQVSARAVDLARAAGDERIQARAEAERGCGLSLLGRLDEAVQVLEEARALAEAVGDAGDLPAVLHFLAIGYGWRGEWTKGKQHLERGVELAERLGNPAHTADLGTLRGVYAFYLGNWRQSRVDLERALAVTRQIDAPRSYAYALFDCGLLSLGEGDWEATSRYCEESIAILEAQGDFQGLRHASMFQAWCDLLQGRADAARARLAPLRDRPGLEERDVTYLLPFLAWAHLELGEVAEAEEVVGQAIRRARAEPNRLALVEALRVQAMVATRQEEWEQAERSLEEGLAGARSLPYPYGEARLLHVHGQMHARKGEPTRARERLEAALAIFRRLGACKDAERAEQAIGEFCHA
jgi:tetratricopeptide (TPR) repeat protein/transcriptional regulator with XRE-family HTH domain